MATQAAQVFRVGPLLADHRLSLRRRVDMTRAGTLVSGDLSWEVSLVDLSTFGCRLAGEHGVVAGERVRLDLGGAAVSATVMWTRDDMLGCRFDVAIARPLMRSLVLGLA